MQPVANAAVPIVKMVDAGRGEEEEVRTFLTQNPGKCGYIEAIWTGFGRLNLGDFGQELHVDVCFNNMLGVYNTRMLRAYASCAWYGSLL